MNLSETVFVYPADGEAHVRLRIFTPAVEIPFAGHPVLGSAFVLAGPLQVETVLLETGVGVIPVHVEREGARIVFGRMEQVVPTWKAYAQADEMLAALGVERSEQPVEVYDNGLQMAFVVLGSEEVAAVEPDFNRLAKLPDVVGTNCCAGSGTRWKTRMFAPGDGVAEDPATARRPARSRFISCGTGLSGPGRRSRSLRARRWAGRLHSSRLPGARPT